jgi:tetraacyldisaccharide 4'-kinase
LDKIKKILLYPFAVLYGLITYLRNCLYDWKLLKATSFDKHTICIGNLAVGGTGKTPHVEYLVRLLRKDQVVATLSRGYKRKTSGFKLAEDISTADDIGDEPLQYKSKFADVIVSVDASRVNGVKKLSELRPEPSVILLDDAFQHRSIKCGLNIVVSEYSNLYLYDHMLPAGSLRESKKGIVRADIIIISKTPERTTTIDVRNIIKDIKALPHQRVFFSWLKYGELYSFDKPSENMDTLNDLYRFKIVVFTGIGNAQPMLIYLKEYGSEVIHISYADHHSYTQADLEAIKAKYDAVEGGNKILVTTEKDAMRLMKPDLINMANKLPLYILPIEVDFKDKAQEFNETILNYVRTNKFYHKKYS